jgi:quercetin dioxygenase-like cupin family protein
MSYFSSGERRDGHIRTQRADELRGFEMAPGVTIYPMVGEGMNINVVELAPNAVASVHSHDEEQLGYVVRGTIDFTDGTTTHTLGPGDTYHAPPGVPHGATAHAEGATIIDAFTPVRAGVRELLDD